MHEIVGNLHMHTPYSDGEKWHRAIADAICHADHGEVELERLEAEKAAERRREQPR